VRGSTSLQLERSPGAPEETIDVDGVHLQGNLDVAPLAWQPLVGRLRELVDRQHISPEDASHASRLRHVALSPQLIPPD